MTQACSRSWVETFLLYGQEKFWWSLLYGKKSVTFPLSCGHLAQEPVEARGAHPPTHLEGYSNICYLLPNNLEPGSIAEDFSFSPICACASVCVCVLSFILVWWLTPLPWRTTMSYVNRGFRDERRVICDVWCVRCLNTLNTALAAVTLCYNHTALWQFITLGKLITGIRHTPTAEIQMDKITNV